MSDTDAEYAAAIAPEIDRIRIAIAHGVRDRGATVTVDSGIGPGEMQMLGMLRNLPPERTAGRAAIDEVFLYQPPGTVATALDALAAAGMVAGDASTVAITRRGVELIDVLFGLTEAVVAAMWSRVDADFAALRALIDRALAAAPPAPGSASSVMMPLYEPEFLSPPTRFAESLTPLRFHRYDAHIAAWRAAGLTVDGVQALPDGPRKDAIEADTNARAAIPYAALSDDERTLLLHTLQTLPIVAV